MTRSQPNRIGTATIRSAIPATVKKPNKYRNEKCVHEGLKFDSKRELARWLELRLLERAAKIANLRRQVTLFLMPGVKFDGAARAQPALRLVVDFVYIENGHEVAEDLKSPATMTQVFRVKRHILLATQGIQLRITQ